MSYIRKKSLGSIDPSLLLAAATETRAKIAASFDVEIPGISYTAFQAMSPEQQQKISSNYCQGRPIVGTIGDKIHCLSADKAARVIPGVTATDINKMGTVAARDRYCGGNNIFLTADNRAYCGTQAGVAVIVTERDVTKMTWNQVMSLPISIQRTLCPPGKVVIIDPSRRNAAGEAMAQCIQGPPLPPGSDDYLYLVCLAQGDPVMQKHANDAKVVWKSPYYDQWTSATRGPVVQPIRAGSKQSCLNELKRVWASPETRKLPPAKQKEAIAIAALQFALKDQGVKFGIPGKEEKERGEALPSVRVRIPPDQDQQVAEGGMPKIYLYGAVALVAGVVGIKLLKK